MNNYILSNSRCSKVVFRYFFVDVSEQNKNFVPNLVVPKTAWDVAKYVPPTGDLGSLPQHPTRPMDIDLIIKYFFCANYTVGHTRARWMARLADDTIVNFCMLGQFIERLEDRYNPLMEFVFKGHCIDLGDEHQMAIPQGGAGFVLSHFACKTVLKHQIPMLKRMLHFEDHSIGRYFTLLDFPAVAMAGNSFVGHPPLQDQLDRLKEGSGMPSCTSVRFEWTLIWRADRCGRFLTPINEIVFVHTTPYLGWDELIKFAMTLFSGPSYIVWWNGFWGYPRFCIERNETVRNLLSFWNSPRKKWTLNDWF
jgi:hypothetical protein